MALTEELTKRGNYFFKYRGYLPLLIIAVGLYVFIQSCYGVAKEPWYEYYFIGCIFISLLGLFIRIMVIGYTGDHTSGRNTSAGQIAEEINQTGLYSWCRHPLYLGNFFMWVGICLFTANVWFVTAFVFLYVIYYERIILAEEDFLIDKFGDKYLEYSEKVPAVIPSFWNWKKPLYSFSWIKVIRQEKSGILWLAVLIFVFKSIHEYIVHDRFIALSSYWFYILCFGIVWYFCVKMIQKQTMLLKVDR